MRRALTRPKGPTRLWREKRFHFIRDDRLVSGVFDRVAITLDHEAHPVAATILDYKSDRVADDAEIATAVDRHREQLILYVEALSRILTLPIDQITAQLLFTRPGRVIDVPLSS